eukprot:TRINITY_DN4337_c0_g1_i1.p1 TRINITY_DN4337_c0_g1~~TRINITY_DN4337_c0_g1_i1.p1  ORF type:complete len:343 (-),score=67.15 TRINITY_DN4337_c0_g1_i1:16-1044(-)
MRSVALLVLLLVVYTAYVTCANPEDTVIYPRTVWRDENRQVIHAHGGGMYLDKKSHPNQTKYYWVGTSIKIPGAFLSEGINLYSSFDLQNWKYEGMIFKNISIHGMSQPGPYRIERPKILFNERTNKFVLWFHLDTASFSLTSVGVATSSVITGPYQFHAGFKPDGQASYDMTVYQDPHDPHSAFLVRSVNNAYAGISKLSPDYLNTTGIISAGPRIEGQSLWYNPHLAKTFLLGSHLTGWSPNPASLNVGSTQYIENHTAWKFIGNPTNNPTSFNTQSAFVFEYVHPNGKRLFILMADDWMYPNVQNADYVWLPILQRDENDYNSIYIPYLSSWRIGAYNS